jgi:MFS family permease
MPLTHSFVTLAAVAMLMGFGNGIGSGIVMTYAADTSPEIGRPKFLGLWRELADGGQGIGPLILSGVTGIADLGTGIVVSGGVGFAAAIVLWIFSPTKSRYGGSRNRPRGGASQSDPARDSPAGGGSGPGSRSGPARESAHGG